MSAESQRSERQDSIVEYLRATNALGVPPSMRQIAEHVGASVGSIWGDLHALVEDGRVERTNPEIERRTRAVWRVTT